MMKTQTNDVLSELRNIQEKTKCMSWIASDYAHQNPKFFVSVKDSICTKDIPTTAGSRILDGYKPPFDATCVERLRKAGGVVVAKTAMDEFGFGSFSTNVGLGRTPPRNPIDSERVCGGSSGGAACLTKKFSKPHIALAQSTGGSIACPASFCGVVGLTPTYGRVSRYGLIDYANSLDKIGPMALTVRQCAEALEIISGKDERDETCADMPAHFVQVLGKKSMSLRIGIVPESFAEGTDPRVANAVKAAVKKLAMPLTEVHLPLTFKYGIPTYYVIAMSEASTNLARYSGLRYGQEGVVEDMLYNDYFSRVRSENLGAEAKRRIMLGTFTRMAGYREAYYSKALRVRRKIIDEYEHAFRSCDVLITPTMPCIAPTFEGVRTLSPLQQYMMDVLTVGPNLAGLPHITIPCGTVDGMPVGLMIIARHFREDHMIEVADLLERLL